MQHVHRPLAPPRPAARRAPGSACLLGTFLCFLAIHAAQAAPAPAGAESVDAVALVNGRPILRRDFDLAVQLQFRRPRPAKVGFEELKAIREKVLDRLIENELLYQKASKEQVAVSPADLDAEVKRLRERFESPKEFAKILGESGVSEAEFREQVRRSLVVTRFVDENVVGDLKATESDLRRYYEQNPSEMVRPEGVRLSQILVRAPAGSSPQERAAARRKIEEILEELRAGQEFADLARKYSEGPEASRGGDSGFLARGNGLRAIERAAFSLQPGETSDVIETRLGFHLIKVAERRPEGPIPFEEAKDAIRAKVLDLERERKLRQYTTGLREKARVERYLTGPS
jgi:peptidyl-prolyl cis-trans isomerase C